MNEKETGGPAFPYEERTSSGVPHRDYLGMTLRDYFAAKALAGLLPAEVVGDYTIKHIAITAYEMADAMLEARK